MKKYLFDMHIHTKETSPCGRVAAADVVKRYKELGYDGLCITDHYSASQLKRHGDTYKEQVDGFLRGYRAAKAHEDEDFHIILGMELRFLENDNDYLVYGFDEEFVYNNDLTGYSSPEEFRAFANENNLIMFQAHPFRLDMTVTDPGLLDGVEVYNGHGDHNSSNDIAYRWAKKYNLRMLSGSDFHGNITMEPGGVYFEEFFADSKQVAQALRDNSYSLKIFTE